MDSILISWLKKLVILLAIFSFIASGLILNVIQFFFLPLYWLNRYWYRIINSKLVYFHWALIPWALQSWANYKIRLFGDADIFKSYANTEHALCVLNHHGELDWMIGWCLIERMGMLGGVKAIMKDVARYIPGIGWMFLFMEYPIVKRNWEQDQERLAKSCRMLANYPINMLLCLFAEGTRFTPEKHEVSMRFAREKNLPLLKHHLLPRTKGFVFLMKHLKVPAIYDLTFAYKEGDSPSLSGVIDRVSCECDILVRRIALSEVPTDSDEECAAWLYKLYQEKDDFVEYHKQHRRFPPPAQYVDIPVRRLPDLVMGMWLVLLGIPVFILALYLLWIKAWFTLATIIGAVMAANQLFFTFVKYTEVRNASTHGLDLKKNGHQNHASKAD